MSENDRQVALIVNTVIRYFKHELTSEELVKHIDSRSIHLKGIYEKEAEKLEQEEIALTRYAQRYLK